VRGIKDLMIKDLVMSKAATIKTLEEAVREGETLLTRKKTLEVHKMHRSGKSELGSGTGNRDRKAKDATSLCHRCGEPGHYAPECSKQNLWCSFCKLKGHCDKACRKLKRDSKSSKANQKNDRRSRKCFALQVVRVAGVHAISTRSPDVQPIYVDVEIEGATAKIERDSGCGVSITPLQRFEKGLPGRRHHPSDIRLKMASGDEI